MSEFSATIGPFSVSRSGITAGKWAAILLPGFETADPDYHYCSFENTDSFYATTKAVSSIQQTDETITDVFTARYDNVQTRAFDINCTPPPTYIPSYNVDITHRNDWSFDGDWYWRAKLQITVFPLYVIFRINKVSGQLSVKTVYEIQFHGGVQQWWSGTVESTRQWIDWPCGRANQVQNNTCTTGNTTVGMGALAAPVAYIGWTNLSTCANASLSHTSASFTGKSVTYTSRQVATWGQPAPSPAFTGQFSCGGVNTGIFGNGAFGDPNTVDNIWQLQETLQRLDLADTSMTMTATETFSV